MPFNSKRKHIAVLLGAINKGYQKKILGGIKSYGRKFGYNIVTFASFGDGDGQHRHDIGEYNILQLPQLEMFDGIVLLTNTIQMRSCVDLLLEKVNKLNIPVVSLDRDIENAYYVGIDNLLPMQKMMDHFIEIHKFTRINFITGPENNPESMLRFQAYKENLLQHNIPIEEDRIFYGNFTRQKGIEAVVTFLKSSLPLPEAIVCSNDNMALSVITALNEYGIDVPKQICVSGFDNTTDARNHCPQLTTVERPLFDVGYAAAETINNHILGLPTEKRKTLKTLPIFTESCGCKPILQNNFETFRKNHYRDTEQLNNIIFQSNKMTEDLAGSLSLLDGISRLSKYIKEIKCDKFYLCLCDDWCSASESYDIDKNISANEDFRIDGYSDRMLVALANEFGQYLECYSFKTSLLIPDLNTDVDEFNSHLFLPLHFQNRCFGYIVICNGDINTDGLLLESWLLNIGNALENIRKQQMLTTVVENLDMLYVRDALTGLYNRRGFDRYSNMLFNKCIEMQYPVMVLYSDLDKLKGINDLYGHDYGDLAIQAIANSLLGSCIADEICARFGGDEYIVFAPNYTENDAKLFCRRLEKRIEKYNTQSNNPYPVNTSVGYYVAVPTKESSLQDFINTADAEMYKNKYDKRSKL